MNVIFTNSFLKKFQKDYRKYNFSIADLASKLRQTHFLRLDEPFCKVKMRLNNVAIRGIVLLNVGGSILPVYIVLKKDKRYGENLIVDKKIEKMLAKMMQDIEQDLKNDNYIEL